jgi:hypothetical protein
MDKIMPKVFKKEKKRPLHNKLKFKIYRLSGICNRNLNSLAQTLILFLYVKVKVLYLYCVVFS